MKKRAFTLIELLFVIAIIGILIAILSPVMGRAREKARQTRCLSNLRQLGVAIYLYLDDNDYYFMPHDAIGNPSQRKWYEAIESYIDDEDLWNCPSYAHANFEPAYMSYGYNANGLTTAGGGGEELRTIRSTSLCILVGDNNNARTPEGGGPLSIGIIQKGAMYPPGTRHSAGANILFVDGHVGWYLQDFLASQGEDWWNY